MSELIHKYYLRPGYDSADLLIEFIQFKDSKQLIIDVIKELESKGFKVRGMEDVWMNDEIWINLGTENGETTITRDIWDFVFILGNNNQIDILRIDEILRNSSKFEKEEVDHGRYKT